jgi:phospholipid/cholesterol/gamma-HCH transport system ATP-binding protein
MAEPEIRKRVDGLLEALEIQHARRLLPSEISGGMRKRAGLARALVLEPEVILYDEPTSGLDPVVSAMVNEMIVATQRRYGVTSIVVTHDMTSAYQIADRIAMLYKGRIIFHGTSEEIKATSDPVVRQFIEGRTKGPIGGDEASSEEDSEVADPSAPADEAGSASGDDESARKEVESGQREKGQP